MATPSNPLPGPAIAVLVGFAVLAIIVIVLSVRQSAARKAGMEQFAATRGWRFSSESDARLVEILGEIDPGERWRVDSVIAVGDPAEETHLFSYSASSGARASNIQYGFACLAAHKGRRADALVSIHPRVPLVEKLLDGMVQTGSQEFQKEFVVTSERAEVAVATVTSDTQVILLEHAAGPQWSLQVRIFGPWVLVTTSWAQKPEEWDYLIRMTRGLAAAVR
jgi:hypothetical protein